MKIQWNKDSNPYDEIANYPELAFFERGSEGHSYDVNIIYEDKRTPNCFVI